MTRSPTDPRSMLLSDLELHELGKYLHLGLRLGDMPEAEYADIVRALAI